MLSSLFCSALSSLFCSALLSSSILLSLPDHFVLFVSFIILCSLGLSFSLFVFFFDIVVVWRSSLFLSFLVHFLVFFLPSVSCILLSFVRSFFPAFLFRSLLPFLFSSCFFTCTTLSKHLLIITYIISLLHYFPMLFLWHFFYCHFGIWCKKSPADSLSCLGKSRKIKRSAFNGKLGTRNHLVSRLSCKVPKTPPRNFQQKKTLHIHITPTWDEKNKTTNWEWKPFHKSSFLVPFGFQHQAHFLGGFGGCFWRVATSKRSNSNDHQLCHAIATLLPQDLVTNRCKIADEIEIEGGDFKTWISLWGPWILLKIAVWRPPPKKNRVYLKVIPNQN